LRVGEYSRASEELVVVKTVTAEVDVEMGVVMDGLGS